MLHNADMCNVKVSVIIPLYNCENYLRECLDSVINQTLSSIEIIIINDSSNDGSRLIVNEYSQFDIRIHAIELTERNGVSVARNIGIEKAIGKYIIFLDADDYWADSGMLNDLCNIADRDSSEITRFGYYRVNNAGQRFINKTSTQELLTSKIIMIGLLLTVR